MNIFKSEQRDERTWKQMLKGWLGHQCESTLNYKGDHHFCTHRSGHNGRHYSLITGVGWGYGDNWLKMSGQ